MDIDGFFKTDKKEYLPGEAIWATLFLENKTNKDVYLFVPRGRVEGIQMKVKEGRNFQIKDMTRETDAGLVPEEKLSPGQLYSHRYLLTQWLQLNNSGNYTIECSLPVESYNISLHQKNEKRVGTNVVITTELDITILPSVD